MSPYIDVKEDLSEQPYSMTPIGFDGLILSCTSLPGLIRGTSDVRNCLT